MIGKTGRPRKPVLRNGYASIGACGKTLYIHRVVYLAQHGAIPDGKCITHLQPPDTDNRIANLAIGRKKSKSKPRMSMRLVKRIRAYKETTQREIAKRCEVTQALVSLIRRGIIWKQKAAA